MQRRYYLLVFLIGFFVCPGSSYSREAIVITPGSAPVNVSAGAGVFLDESSLVTARDIASGKYDQQFISDGRKTINFGIIRGTSWVTFRLAGAGRDRAFVSVQYPTADSVTLYTIKNGQAMEIGAGGLFAPISARQVPTENYMFDLGLGSDTTTYLLSVKSSRVHMYALTAGYLADYTAVINRDTLWNAAFIGFILLIALYHIFLFIAIGNLPYIYYVGYVVWFGLFNIYINGSALLYLWPSHPWLNFYDNLLTCISGFFSTLFLSSSLDLRKQAPVYRKIFLCFRLLFVVNGLVALSGYPFASFLFMRNITPLWLVVCLLATITVLRAGYKPARYFVASGIVASSGVAIFLAGSFNLIEYNFLMAHSMQVTTMLEALILSFALADRFNRYKREKEQLMRTQNEMLEQKVAERTQELKKQQRETELLLLNILPEEVATELKENGVARSRNYEAVTVLFTDFKDFTRIVEKISPEQLVADLNFCFSAFDKIIEQYGVEKIKTIGDSYMCAGGIGVSQPDHVRDVVQAGIEIRDFIDERNRNERERGGSNILEVRIGIHTGPVIAGIIGIKKFAYDIWGDTVNIASRLETAGEIGKVNVSGFTYELVKDHFTCTYRGKIPAKNKGDVDMYFVERR